MWYFKVCNETLSLLPGSIPTERTSLPYVGSARALSTSRGLTIARAVPTRKVSVTGYRPTPVCLEIRERVELLNPFCLQREGEMGCNCCLQLLTGREEQMETGSYRGHSHRVRDHHKEEVL